jgi:hypothetical protein
MKQNTGIYVLLVVLFITFIAGQPMWGIAISILIAGILIIEGLENGFREVVRAIRAGQ